MKTTSIILNFVLIAVVLYLGFFNRSTAQQAQQRNCNILCADYSLDNSFRGIDLHLAKLLADNYAKDEGKKFIGNGRNMTTTEDARNAWFPLETIKRFIWQIESAACKKSCTNKMRLGIRIYYGKYPDANTMLQTPGLADVQSRYALHHTVFMVPTFSDGGRDVDFDPWHWGGSGCKPTSIKEYLANNWKVQSPNIAILAAGYTRAGDAQNHGDMSPPPSGSGEFGTE
ncbi:hypothetical protein EGT74_13505 [Chitinophaga lutea]|uniref:Uncharacterized protein n=1 Tax=Chitinophaga lutea TaxID=2488634 RepID=A0A3N4PHA3_9BACT|nr:hypothetical protein [Chitinophaga lutea]RPE08082.1 hypothetical protein EGT74_13505 [Chitinophaga lutea]